MQIHVDLMNKRCTTLDQNQCVSVNVTDVFNDRLTLKKDRKLCHLANDSELFLVLFLNRLFLTFVRQLKKKVTHRFIEDKNLKKRS